MCPVRYSTPFPRRCPSRKFSWPSRATVSSIFSFEYFGSRTNSAAIQPRFRSIPRMTFLRRSSLQSGTEPTVLTAENTRTSTAARIGWAIFIAATLYVCYFSHLGAIGFVGPDEPRYAWIARDMAETGDWVTPRLYGKPWFEKPPLFYWSAALCFKLFGVSEAAARLPSVVSALLATLAMAWLALRLYGAETARWLLLLLPTTPSFSAEAPFFSGPFSPNAGATPFASFIQPPCHLFVLRLSPGISFALVGTPIFSASSSSNTISSVTSPPNSSTSSRFGFT